MNFWKIGSIIMAVRCIKCINHLSISNGRLEVLYVEYSSKSLSQKRNILRIYSLRYSTVIRIQQGFGLSSYNFVNTYEISDLDCGITCNIMFLFHEKNYNFLIKQLSISNYVFVMLEFQDCLCIVTSSHQFINFRFGSR